MAVGANRTRGVVLLSWEWDDDEEADDIIDGALWEDSDDDSSDTTSSCRADDDDEEDDGSTVVTVGVNDGNIRVVTEFMLLRRVWWSNKYDVAGNKETERWEDACSAVSSSE